MRIHTSFKNIVATFLLVIFSLSSFVGVASAQTTYKNKARKGYHLHCAWIKNIHCTTGTTNYVRKHVQKNRTKAIVKQTKRTSQKRTSRLINPNIALSAENIRRKKALDLRESSLIARDKKLDERQEEINKANVALKEREKAIMAKEVEQRQIASKLADREAALIQAQKNLTDDQTALFTAQAALKAGQDLLNYWWIGIIIAFLILLFLMPSLGYWHGKRAERKRLGIVEDEELDEPFVTKKTRRKKWGFSKSPKEDLSLNLNEEQLGDETRTVKEVHETETVEVKNEGKNRTLKPVTE